MLTVIIPSYNEENYVAACLDAIVEQTDLERDHAVQVIVAANGCRDQTVALAQGKGAALKAAGFALTVIDIEEGNKMNALNKAEEIATYDSRVFLDADVIIGPRILRELADILAEDTPLYASGNIRIPRPKNIFSRAYAKVWGNLPFVRNGVPGIGLYAMNAKARSRWDAFPRIYSDDRFVRLHFAPNERRKTNATYDWPLPEGLGNLIHVRLRWTEGNVELAQKYPDLLANDSQRNKMNDNLRSLLRTPFSSIIFVMIFVISGLRAKRIKHSDAFIWRRGRD